MMKAAVAQPKVPQTSDKQFPNCVANYTQNTALKNCMDFYFHALSLFFMASFFF